MELVEAVKRRRSIRKFKHKPIEESLFLELLEAARLAPSGTNIQPWRFLAVTSKDMKTKLADCTFNLNFIIQAPVVMVCCADLTALASRDQRRKELREAGAFVGTDLENISLEEYQKRVRRDDAANLAYLKMNVAIAIEHMVLRATDLGLGSCWLLMFDEKKVKELLELPERLHVTALVPFGYPDQEPNAPPKLPLEDIFLGKV